MKLNVLHVVISAIFISSLILAGIALTPLTLGADIFANVETPWLLSRTTVAPDLNITLDSASQIDRFILEAQSNQLPPQHDIDLQLNSLTGPDVGPALPEFELQIQTIDRNDLPLKPAQVTVIIN